MHCLIISWNVCVIELKRLYAMNWFFTNKLNWLILHFVFFFAPGMIAMDTDGHMAAGTSTNGLSHKVPGCVDFILLMF